MARHRRYYSARAIFGVARNYVVRFLYGAFTEPPRRRGKVSMGAPMADAIVLLDTGRRRVAAAAAARHRLRRLS